MTNLIMTDLVIAIEPRTNPNVPVCVVAAMYKHAPPHARIGPQGLPQIFVQEYMNTYTRDGSAVAVIADFVRTRCLQHVAPKHRVIFAIEDALGSEASEMCLRLAQKFPDDLFVWTNKGAGLKASAHAYERGWTLLARTRELPPFVYRDAVILAAYAAASVAEGLLVLVNGKETIARYPSEHERERARRTEHAAEPTDGTGVQSSALPTLVSTSSSVGGEHAPDSMRTSMLVNVTIQVVDPARMTDAVERSGK